MKNEIKQIIPIVARHLGSENILNFRSRWLVAGEVVVLRFKGADAEPLEVVIGLTDEQLERQKRSAGGLEYFLRREVLDALRN